MRLLIILTLASINLGAQDNLVKVGHDLNLLRNNMSKTLIHKKEILPQFRNPAHPGQQEWSALIWNLLSRKMPR